MSKTAPEILRDWFEGLSDEQKQEVLRFVYGSAYTRKALKEGTYCGPAPEMIKKGGLYTGPAPSGMQSSPSVCPGCGRPY